jgi:hypothetical protein
MSCNFVSPVCQAALIRDFELFLSPARTRSARTTVAAAMEKRSIFKLGDYLSQLEVVSVEETKVVDRGASASSATSAPVIRDASTRDGEISSCNSCKKSFDSPAEQRQHYQSKWHLYDLP